MLEFSTHCFWFCYPQFHPKILNHLLLQSDNAEQESSDSHFMRLVQNLLRDPDERKNFFQVSFGYIFLYKRMYSISVFFVSVILKLVKCKHEHPRDFQFVNFFVS